MSSINGAAVEFIYYWQWTYAESSLFFSILFCVLKSVVKAMSHLFLIAGHSSKFEHDYGLLKIKVQKCHGVLDILTVVFTKCVL
jgi:hypothetical protein